MHFKPLFPIIIAASLFAGIAADKPDSSGVIHLDHEKVAAVFAKGGTLLATNNFKVMALRRDTPGEVEVHDADTDIFYILDGSATFVTGGKISESRIAAPGETRAKNLTGGEERRLSKGDVIVVPNRVPHWFKAVSGPFLYYVVKVSR